MTGEKNLPQLANVDANFEDVISDLKGVAGAFNETQLLKLIVPQEIWEGAAKGFYEKELQILKEKISQLSVSVGGCEQALENVKSKIVEIRKEITKLQAEWDQITGEYNKKIDSLNNERTTDFIFKVSAAELMKNSKHEECLKKYKKLIEDLDNTADTAVSKISQLIGDLVPSNTHFTRNGIGAAYLSDMRLAGGQARWDYAQEVAPDIVNVIENENPTENDIEEFVNKYSYLLGDPFVVTAISERTSSEKMLEFTLRIRGLHNNNIQLSDRAMSSVGTLMILMNGGINLDGLHQIEQNSFESVKDGLKSENGRSIAEIRQSRMEEFKKIGRKEFNIRKYGLTTYDVSYGYKGDYTMFGYDIYSQITGFAAKNNNNIVYGDSFFEKLPSGLSLAQDIVSWDNKTRRWVSCHELDDNILLFRKTGNLKADLEFCDPLSSMYLLMDRPNALVDQSIHDYPNLLEAEKRRYYSAQTFMTSEIPFDLDTDGDGKPDKNARLPMVRYLTGHRQASTGFNSYHGFSDGGEGFGEVVKELSEPGTLQKEPIPSQFSNKQDYKQAHAQWNQNYNEWKACNYRATKIAGNFLYGYQDGLDSPIGNKKEGQDSFGYNNSNLRSWAGLILAPHMDGITSSLGGDYSTDLGIKETDLNRRHEIAFNRKFATKLVGDNGVFLDLGFDKYTEAKGPQGPRSLEETIKLSYRPAAMDSIFSAVQAGYSRDLAEALSLPADHRGAGVKGIINKWAPAVNVCVTTPIEAEGEAKSALDKRNEEWQKLIKYGYGIIPYSRWIGKGFGFVAGKAEPPILDNLLESWLPTNNAKKEYAKIPSARDTGEMYMKQVLYASIAEHGDFNVASEGMPTKAQIAVANLSPQNNYVDSNGKVIPYEKMTDDQRLHFEDAINSDNIAPAGRLDGYYDYFNEIDTSYNNMALKKLESRFYGSK